MKCHRAAGGPWAACSRRGAARPGRRRHKRGRNSLPGGGLHRWMYDTWRLIITLRLPRNGRRHPRGTNYDLATRPPTRALTRAVTRTVTPALTPDTDGDTGGDC